MSNHFFSTGRIRVGAPGNTALSNSDIVGEIQDVSFTTKFDTKDVHDAASISLFPVDSANDNGDTKLKFTSVDFSRILLAYACGAAKTTAGGQDVYTIGALSKPQYARIEFDGVDTNGKAINLVGTRVKAPGFSGSFKQGDYVMPDVEFTFYPDPAATVANQVAQIRIDQ